MPIPSSSSSSSIDDLVSHMQVAPFQSFRRLFAIAGGRGAEIPDQIPNHSNDGTEKWEPSSCHAQEAKLIILQITDVYTLENFASFKTLLKETRAKSQGAKVVCILTGDFLSPYLLSGVDKGAGMMNALSKIPIDYLIWGNHEADIDHATVCRYVRNFPGKFLNSNMLDHDAMDAQLEYDVLELISPDGTNRRKVGLCAVLSNDPKLYSHFPAPGAFGGATITDPWKALAKYNRILRENEGCDLVLPLEHLYVPEDLITCEKFDFPVILSGHDHHRVDQMHCGTRLLKPGMNAEFATVLEISFPTSDTTVDPVIHAQFVRCKDWEPDRLLELECRRAYDVLKPLSNTELARIPSRFFPLTSNGSRESVCTMGKFICSMLKSSLNASRQHRNHDVDAVLLMGGNNRGNMDYPQGSFFSLEALMQEIKSDEVVGIVTMPGWLLADGIQATHSGDPKPGWMQYDEGVIEDDGTTSSPDRSNSPSPRRITHVGGKPLIPSRLYRVATKISDLTNGQSPPWTKYYQDHADLLPAKGSYVNIHAELMSYFARNIWRRLWNVIALEVGRDPESRLTTKDPCFCDPGMVMISSLDQTGDGIVTVDDIQVALQEKLGCSVDEREKSLAEFIISFADQTGDGRLCKKDFQIFANLMNNDSHEQYYKEKSGGDILQTRLERDVTGATDGLRSDEPTNNKNTQTTGLTASVVTDIESSSVSSSSSSNVCDMDERKKGHHQPRLSFLSELFSQLFPVAAGVAIDSHHSSSIQSSEMTDSDNDDNHDNKNDGSNEHCSKIRVSDDEEEDDNVSVPQRKRHRPRTSSLSEVVVSFVRGWV